MTQTLELGLRPAETKFANCYDLWKFQVHLPQRDREQAVGEGGWDKGLSLDREETHRKMAVYKGKTGNRVLG